VARKSCGTKIEHAPFRAQAHYRHVIKLAANCSFWIEAFGDSHGNQGSRIFQSLASALGARYDGQTRYYDVIKAVAPALFMLAIVAGVMVTLL